LRLIAAIWLLLDVACCQQDTPANKNSARFIGEVIALQGGTP
jgi:hypothetical protein